MVGFPLAAAIGASQRLTGGSSTGSVQEGSMRSFLKSLAAVTLFFSPFAVVGLAQGFRSVSVDAGKEAGRIRSLQGVNGSPLPVMAGLPNLVEPYRDLRIDQVRTHDLMGPTEIDSRYAYRGAALVALIPDPVQRIGVVKAGNASIIFPDWNADAEKPESYRFGPTDKVIAAIRASGAEVYYRIGRSWGAATDPPPDYDKFANIVKHIAMHYNQGWANGFHDKIRYWEFWNEPEGFWGGTPEQFDSLYEKTARALKSVDPDLKVGGDGQASAHGVSPWREGLLDYCASHHVPLDFFSWHTYAYASADPYDAVRLGREVRHSLDTHGFPHAESILSEWNFSYDYTIQEAAELQSAHNAAFVGAVLTYLQDAPIDHAHLYRGDAAWMGLFDLNGNYYKPAYVFKAMGQMLNTPMRLAVTGADTFGFAVLAGRSEDGNTVQILISNYAKTANFKPRPMIAAPETIDPTLPPLWNRYPSKPLPERTGIVYRDNAGYDLSIAHLPWGNAAFSIKRYRISARQSLDLVEQRSAEGPSLRLSDPLSVDTVELIVLERKAPPRR
jgi:xylan 1,4-beta-xylosidase